MVRITPSLAQQTFAGLKDRDNEETIDPALSIKLSVVRPIIWGVGSDLTMTQTRDVRWDLIGQNTHLLQTLTTIQTLSTETDAFILLHSPVIENFRGELLEKSRIPTLDIFSGCLPHYERENSSLSALSALSALSGPTPGEAGIDSYFLVRT